MPTADKATNVNVNTDGGRSRRVAIALAFAGALPIPLPIAWIHKFYLGQYLWGVTYLVLAPTGLPQVACCLEGLWYTSLNDEDFSAKFPSAGTTLSASAALAEPAQVPTLRQRFDWAFKIGQREGLEDSNQPLASPAAVLRELDQLRKEGLITEYEFEQKRRKLLDKIR